MYIFYYAGVKFEEVAGVTGRIERRHRTLALESGVLSVPGPVRVKHRTQGITCSRVRCGLSLAEVF